MLVRAGGARYNDRFGVAYALHTNLADDEAQDYLHWADRVHEAMADHLGVREKLDADGPIPLYLYRTAWQYRDALAQMGVDAGDSRAIFFVGDREIGVAAFTQGIGVHDVVVNLLHETFHELAHRIYHDRLPIWLNEGFARHYQDGVFLGDRLTLGIAEAARLRRLSHTLALGQAVPFVQLLSSTREQWRDTRSLGLFGVAMLYDWSWAYLAAMQTHMHSELDALLAALADGATWDAAWANTFAGREARIEAAGHALVRDSEPHPLAVTFERMALLGYATAAMMQAGVRISTDVEQLQRRMRMLGMEIVRPLPGATQKDAIRGGDDTLFWYPTEDGLNLPFELIESDAPRLPPGIAAPLCAGSPRLTWRADATGSPISCIRTTG